ncbi:hypothetical protein N665_2060s0008 [Sinapis alba]|nr:hypothetical protein N665_2060s0008 [Sinapis alba]
MSASVSEYFSLFSDNDNSSQLLRLRLVINRKKKHSEETLDFESTLRRILNQIVLNRFKGLGSRLSTVLNFVVIVFSTRKLSFLPSFYSPFMQVARFISLRPWRLSFSVAATAMNGDDSCSLVFCGKSSAENDTAKRLKNNNLLKLPDDTKVSLFLASEMKNLVRDDDGSFNLSLFMNSLSTARFGRFLIWSPRLSSTHDVVSHNFSELPVGSVCVSDIQFKGRGKSLLD